MFSDKDREAIEEFYKAWNVFVDELVKVYVPMLETVETWLNKHFGKWLK